MNGNIEKIYVYVILFSKSDKSRRGDGMAKESKYMKIYRVFQEAIEHGTMKAGEKLPTEGELMEKYDASRDTVRKSLNLLVHNGYIQKARGKVAVVLPRDQFNFPVSEISSFRELKQLMGMDAETSVENLEILTDMQKVREIFDIDEEDEVFELYRVRKVDGERIILDKDYFKRSVVPNLPLSACRNSVYEYLENELGLKIGYATKEITVQTITDEDKKYLDLGQYDMVVVVKSYTYLFDNKFFQYTESRHRPDKFRFVDFARRTH